jgi:hypothetical protein
MRSIGASQQAPHDQRRKRKEKKGSPVLRLPECLFWRLGGLAAQILPFGRCTLELRRVRGTGGRDDGNGGRGGRPTG